MSSTVDNISSEASTSNNTNNSNTASSKHSANVFEDAIMRGAADGTLALSQLAEFEELFSRVGGDQSALIHTILKRDSNLEQVLSETERRQDTIFDSFIEQHCEQMPLLCAMFDEVSKCEAKLLEFESSIASFQERLTATAEGIAHMQEETVRLRTRLTNRHEVSDRLKQVYEALHETERFCEVIIAGAAAPVDEQFLMNIRQLESKIAFLADNEELGGSAIENEMRPKLVAAAQKAGDKLHEFLIRRLSSLSAENANISLHQQAVERSGQYAFSFLSKYNQSIAAEITNYYTQIMTDVYTRTIRAAIKLYEDVSAGNAATIVGNSNSSSSSDAGAVAAAAATTRPFESYVTIEIAKAFAATPQSMSRFVDPRASPIVNRVSHAAIAAALARKKDSNKSFTDSIRGFFNRGDQTQQNAAGGASSSNLQQQQGPDGNRRPAMFADFVHVLQGIDISSSSRSMNFDPLLAQMVGKSSCWVFSLATMLMKVVNCVVSEARFLDNFFFLSNPATEREEAMLAAVFAEPLRVMQDLVRDEVYCNNDPVALLAAHRVVELVKNFLTQCCNPLPIMLLTVPLENIFLGLNRRLHELLDLQLETLRSFASCAPFKKFTVPPPSALGGLLLSSAAAAGSSSSSGGGGDGSSAAAAAANAGGAANLQVGGSARFVDLVQTDRQLAQLLGPNEIVRRFATLAGQLVCVNTLKLEGSRVSAASLDESERVCYDDIASDKLMAAVSLMANIGETTSTCHTTALAKAICKVNCFGHIYFTWKSLEPAVAAPAQSTNATAAAAGASTTTTATTTSDGQKSSTAARSASTANQQHHHHHNRQLSVVPDRERALVESTSTYTLAAAECRLLDEVLKMAISDFVAIDAQTVDIFAPTLKLLDSCSADLLQSLLNDDKPQQSAATTTSTASPPPPCNEQELLAVLVPFHKGWLDALTAVVQRLRVFFSERDGPYQLVVKEYFAFLADKVKKMHAFVTRFFPKSATVKSKTVGPQTFWNELSRLM